MKKILLLFLVCTLLLTGCLHRDTPAETLSTQPSTVPAVPTLEGEERYRLSPGHIFPFVYTNDVGFAWFEEHTIGPNNCQIGHFYIKNKEDGTITEVYDKPLVQYLCTRDHIYYIPEETPNSILRWGYEDQTHTVIYRAPEGKSLNGFSYWGLDDQGTLFVLVDHKQVMLYDIPTQTTRVILAEESILWATMYYDEKKDEPYVQWAKEYAAEDLQIVYDYYYETGQTVESAPETVW